MPDARPFTRAWTSEHVAVPLDRHLTAAAPVGADGEGGAEREEGDQQRPPGHPTGWGSRSRGVRACRQSRTLRIRSRPLNGLVM